MFALLGIARIYKALKLFADLQGPICYNDPQNKGINFIVYCWFSHDVTKFQTSELLILLRFYFHDVLEQLKTNLHTNFHSEWVLCLVIDYA